MNTATTASKKRGESSCRTGMKEKRLRILTGGKHQNENIRLNRICQKRYRTEAEIQITLKRER